MVHSESTGFEMLGDYIEVDGPKSEGEVLEALSHLIGPRGVPRATACLPLATLDDGRTIVFVDVDVDERPLVTLAIGNLDHDDQARERATRAIQEALTRGTSWGLTCSSDSGQ